MPGPVEDVIVVPQVLPITVGLEPVHNALYSLLLLLKGEQMPGLSDWVARTEASLTQEERETLELVMIGFHYAVLPEQSWPSFPAYLDHLAASDSVVLRDKMLDTYATIPCVSERDCWGMEDEPALVDWDTVLTDADAYLRFLRDRFEPIHVDADLETRAYGYVIDPPAMQALIVSHLREMWDKYLAPEWVRVTPMLQDAVTAFQQIDFGDMNRLEAAQLITGQKLGEEKWKKGLEKAERVIFVPSAHLGPYLGKFHRGDTLWMLFGARLPEGVAFDAPDLSRAEIIVRLNALADDNRLRILKLISDQGELRSQDVMERLDLSQSAASRHLKQLSATGYLVERRCNGAKCYNLDAERVKNTLRAISDFLLGTSTL